MEYYYYFTFNNCRVPRTLAGSSCYFFREDKYLDLEADMVSSGVFLTINPYIFSKADLNFWKFFFSHFVCPRCPRDLLVSQKQYIEKECVVYPDTLTSFNPSKLTSFWLLSEWPILPRPFRHLFRSQMMFILFNSIHSSIDLFLFIGCSCRTRHSLNCFHVTICKGKNRCFSLKYYKKEI